MKRLVWLTECVHGYEGVCSFGDCPGGTFENADAFPELAIVRDGETIIDMTVRKPGRYLLVRLSREKEQKNQ